MKKPVIFAVLLFFITAVSAFSQLVNYPEALNNGTVLLSGGIGFGKALDSKMRCPPLIVSGDFAIPFMSLPFTVGLSLAYSSEAEGPFSSNNLGIGMRLGYHYGWGLKNLDTYVLLTLGDILAWESISSNNPQIEKTNELHQIFWYGIGIGGRYFFLPRLGAYAELTLANLNIFTFGISCKI